VRILILDTYYPTFLEDHYHSRPRLADEPYEVQLRSLLDRCFGTADAYSSHLRALGHEAAEVIANCEPLQVGWAREEGLRRSSLRRLASLVPGKAQAVARRVLLADIAQAQIDEFGPDVLYFQDLRLFSLRRLDEMRRRKRLIVGQVASALPPRDRLRRFDLITTSFPHYVERIRRLGVDSEYLRLGFYETVLDRLKHRGVQTDASAERPFLVTFVGGLHPRVHGPRTRLLERLAERTALDVWGYGAEALPRDSPLLSGYHGMVWGLDMYEVLAHTKIALNRHIGMAEGYANNMRLFEATGVGALLLTERAPNLNSLFVPGIEAVEYTDERDLLEKIRYYSEHDGERRSLAAAGQARTLSEHTYGKRLAELVEILESRA
jgi:spore maturation protein CgeB